MSLLSGNGGYVDLLGQNNTSLLIDVDELIVNDSIELKYATPNKNLVVDADKKVITEDKDTIVGTTNQVIVNQVGRQFTLSLPQDIATDSQVEFKTLDVNDIYIPPVPVFGSPTASGIWFGTTKNKGIVGDAFKLGILINGSIDYNFSTSSFTPTFSYANLGRPFDDESWETLYCRKIGSSSYRVNDIYGKTIDVETKIIPTATNTVDIGENAKRIKDYYGKTIDIDTKLIPTATNTVDIGENAKRIKDYYGKTIDIDTKLIPTTTNTVDIGENAKRIKQYYGKNIDLGLSTTPTTIQIAFASTLNNVLSTTDNTNDTTKTNSSGRIFSRQGALSTVKLDFTKLANDMEFVIYVNTLWGNRIFAGIVSDEWSMGGSFLNNANSYMVIHLTAIKDRAFFRSGGGANNNQVLSTDIPLQTNANNRGKQYSYKYKITTLGVLTLEYSSNYGNTYNTVYLNGTTNPYTKNLNTTDKYHFVCYDDFTSQSFMRTQISGTFNEAGSLTGELKLKYLDTDKNLVIDNNNNVVVEDRDTIVGTANQVIVNQVGRQFTLSTPQDIATTSAVTFSTVNTGQGNNELYAMDQNVRTTDPVSFESVQADIKTFVIESIATPNSFINLTATNINMAIGGNPNKIEITNTDINNNFNATDTHLIIHSENNSYRNGIAFTRANNNFVGRFYRTNGINGNISIAVGNDPLISNLNQVLTFDTQDFKIILNQLSAYNVLFLDADKKITGLTLGEDEVLVGRSGNTPIAQTKDTFYELHQNQLGSKIDPLKTASSIEIRAGGLGIRRTGTGRGRALCINSFKSPLNNGLNASGFDYRRRFGFEIIAETGVHICLGFCLESTFTNSPNDALTGDAGSWAYRIGNGDIFENGTNVASVASSTVGDVIEFEIFQQTSAPYRTSYQIIKNGIQILYTSGTLIPSGDYYPQIFDSDSTSSTLQVNLAQTFHGAHADITELETNRLKLNSIFYVNRNRFNTTEDTILISTSSNWTTIDISTSGTISGFSSLSNTRFEYLGYDAYFNISYIISMRPTNNTSPRQIGSVIYVNSTRIDKSGMWKQVKTDTESSLTYTGSTITQLTAGDKVQPRVINNTDTANLYIDSFKIQITPLHF